MTTNRQRELVAALIGCILKDLATSPATKIGEIGEIIDVGRKTDGGQAGAVVSWFPSSAFEHAVSVVVPFGAVKLDPDGRMCFTLLVSVDQVEEYTVKNFPNFAIDLHGILVAFLSLSCLQLGLLPSTRQWFTPRLEYVPMMRRFAEHGYAGQLDGQFRWTDQIGKAMYEACQWNEAFENLEDIENVLIERKWNTMPASAKLRYFLGEFNPTMADQYVCQCWDGEN